MTNSRLGATALLLATFVIGGLVGGAATTMVDHRAHGARGGSRGPSGFVARLADQLSLTPAQRDSIQAVLDRHQPAMDSLWNLIKPQFDNERQGIRREIGGLLTPEQQAKYAAMIQRLDSVHKAQEDRSRNGRR